MYGTRRKRCERRNGVFPTMRPSRRRARSLNTSEALMSLLSRRGDGVVRERQQVESQRFLHPLIGAEDPIRGHVNERGQDVEPRYGQTICAFEPPEPSHAARDGGGAGGENRRDRRRRG